MHFCNYTREQVRAIELYYICGTRVSSTAILGQLYLETVYETYATTSLGIYETMCFYATVAEQCTAGV